jgi:hypothetical protein
MNRLCVASPPLLWCVRSALAGPVVRPSLGAFFGDNVGTAEQGAAAKPLRT